MICIFLCFVLFTSISVLTVLTVVRRSKLILKLCQSPPLLLEFRMKYLDWDHCDQQDEGGDGSSVPDELLVCLVLTPVARPHAVLRPVDVPVELEEAVAVPHPEQEDEGDAPDQPQQHDPLAELLSAADQSDVDQETDD